MQNTAVDFIVLGSNGHGWYNQAEQRRKIISAVATMKNEISRNEAAILHKEMNVPSL